MTIKILTGTYTAGYTLSAHYSGLYAAPTALVEGDGVVAFAPATIVNAGTVRSGPAMAAGDDGPAGIDLLAGGRAVDTGRATGGRGGASSYRNDLYVQAGLGGAGVSVAAGGGVTNHGALTGGVGGRGGLRDSIGDGANGGSGGAGVGLTAGGVVANGGALAGGLGGAGGDGGSSSDFGGSGGQGGFGVEVAGAAGQVANNHGAIVGGHGGAGGAARYNGGFGGNGGTGVYASAGLGVINQGVILGGMGGVGGATADHYNPSGYGGGGGGGVIAEGDASLVNSGTIAGGQGAAAAAGALFQGPGGGGGVGVFFLPEGGYVDTLINRGSIAGGAGGEGGTGIGGYTGYGAGGYGIFLDGVAAVLDNDGAVSGGAGGDCGYGYSAIIGSRGGDGIVFSATGSLLNSGDVTGGRGGAGGTGRKSTVAAGGVGGIGIDLRAAATLTNRGTIAGGQGGAGPGPAGARGDGVDLYAGGSYAGGSVINSAGGLIEGAVGVYAEPMGVATVTNAGMIQGDVNSVKFTSSADLLIAQSGAQFVGAIAGGGGTLELAGGKGTISGLGASGTLSGAVSATFSGFSAYAIDAGAVWTLAGSGVLAVGQTLTIAGALADTGALSGAGLVTGPGSLSIASGAVIDADTAGGLVLEMTGQSVVNEGLLEATGPGLLLIENTTVNNAVGSVVASGVRVDLEGATIVGGSLSSVGAGAVAVEGGDGAVFDGTGRHPVSLSGKVVVEDGAFLTIEGAVVNAATIFVEGASHVTELAIGVGGATLSGGGSISLGSSGQSHIFAAQPAATTLDNADNTISGAGTISDANFTLVNAAAGVIDGNAGQSLVLSTGANTIANAGVIEARGSGGVVVRSALANTGLIYAEGGNLTVNGAVTGTGTARVKGATLDFTSAFTQNVTFTGPTGVLELADFRAYTGTVSGFSTGGGTGLDLGDIGFVSAGEATFSGTATSGVLTVTDGTHTAHITLEGDYLVSTFTAAGDGHGGTMVTASAAPAHRFIAAAASLGGSAAISVHADAARMTPSPMLSRPHVMVA